MRKAIATVYYIHVGGHTPTVTKQIIFDLQSKPKENHLDLEFECVTNKLKIDNI